MKVNIKEIQKFKIFENVDEDKILKIFTSHSYLIYNPGDKLITRFKENKSLFLLLKGSVEIYLDKDYSAQNIVNEGDIIGEISVLDGLPASSSAIALTHCNVLEISENEIWKLVSMSHIFTINLLKYVSIRLRDFNSQVDSSIKIQQKLERKASVDALTGLYNRRWFDDNFDMIFNRCIKNKQDFSFIMIDVDHFKRINDDYGHAIGDIILHEMGIILKAHARERDAAIRYGGEELCLILPDTNKENALMIATRLREIIEDNTFNSAGVDNIYITISLGCSFYSGSENKSDLMKLADDALYKAKKKGRNRVCY